ncbi:MAG: aspartate kinase [Methanomassiliicoccales archaeon]|nr:aspartate kinase [Methanomassiliicoccales archaeon]
MLKVMKFGGTSVGSGEAMERAASIVSVDPAKKVLVVSAMSGVTNMLIAWTTDKTVTPGTLVKDLREKHMTAVQGRLPNNYVISYSSQLDAKIQGLTERLEKFRKNPDPAQQDSIASWGERLSSLTMSLLLRGKGLDAVSMTSEEAGIVATGPPGNGSADLEATSRNLKRRLIPMLEGGKVPVLTGYYGCDAKLKPVTFGRGGSDYSASVIAYGLDADCLEIWTDVDGFMTADPRIVKRARTIKEMDYGEAGELAYFGARVLHPRSIEPVRRKHIRTLVKNTFNPEGTGTTIHNLRSRGKDLLRSVAMKSDLSIVKVYSSEIVYYPRFVSNLLSSISDNGVNTYAISTSLSTLAVVIPSSDLQQVLKRINDAGENKIEKLTVKDKVSLICAVGDNMLDVRGVAAKIFGIVDQAEANVELISEGASDVALNFVVPADRAVEVVKKLHENFIGD